jgi:hypothetical protein
MVQFFFSISTRAQQIDSVYFSQISNDTISAHIYVSSNHGMDFLSYSQSLNNDTINMALCFSINIAAVISNFDTIIDIPVSLTTNSYVFNLKTNISSSQDSCVYASTNDSISMIVKTPVNITEITSNMISIFPNPSNDVIFIDNTYNIQIYNTVFMDVCGKIVYSHSGYISKIHVNDLLNGLYLLELKTEKGVFIKKIMIE